MRKPLQLSRPLMLAFAAVIACSALIGAMSRVDQDSDAADPEPSGISADLRPAPQAAVANDIEIALAQATLKGTGFVAAGNPVRHEQTMEVPVRDAEGHNWVAWLDKAGRASEVEIVDYEEDKVPEAPTFRPEDLPGMIAKDGFQSRGEAERRPEHFEIRAVNQRSELVNLYVDFAGQIYKQVWVR
ncbi:hypothetical protein PY365_25255 [Roseiarcaceae bacterium H3SJ34-1]|uniref:hypothetical protein n=1 Tax=Terripilifer ovatus TaxID=3032367 RepID=UPI003AB987FB|nr:hypothetical protein [Roseiarcaceae bacterium H3SJ34-1]